MTSSEHYVPCLKFAVEFKGCAHITWPWQDPHQDTNTRSPTNHFAPHPDSELRFPLQTAALSSCPAL